MDEGQFTPDVGTKFYAGGSVRTFPGNTVICFVDPIADAQVFGAAVWAQEKLRDMNCAGKMAFLPPDSFHMTVMDLVCDQVRQPERWSSMLTLDCPLDEVDGFFIDRLSSVEPSPSFRMSFVRIRRPGIVIALEPADAETADALTAYREKIATATGVRFPDHDSYGFHISLAYNLISLDDDEEQELVETFAHVDQRLAKTFGIFEPSPPQLTFFDDMFEFLPEDERHTLNSRG